ncbi:unnamed protein product [Amoebophrya sp. A25]|nr:unnamed protein product [Amoebophrya sp. A25]|eukprot:GSA25T00021364001.1
MPSSSRFYTTCLVVCGGWLVLHVLFSVPSHHRGLNASLRGGLTCKFLSTTSSTKRKSGKQTSAPTTITMNSEETRTSSTSASTSRTRSSSTTSTATKSRPAPKVGLAIAVHRPKFRFLSRFLREYARCSPAWHAFSLHVVFSDKKDLRTFKKALTSLDYQDVAAFAHPEVDDLLDLGTKAAMGEDAARDHDGQTEIAQAPEIKHSGPRSPYPWRAVVANVPPHLHKAQDDTQAYSGWKKWYGMVHMLDLPLDERPEFGAMLDAEVLINNFEDACRGGSSKKEVVDHLEEQKEQMKESSSSATPTQFSYLFERALEKERQRRFPAAAVSDDIEIYNISKTNSWTGRSYDLSLMHRTLTKAVDAANGANRIRLWRYLLSKRSLRDPQDRLSASKYRWENAKLSLADGKDEDKLFTSLVSLRNSSSGMQEIGRPEPAQLLVDDKSSSTTTKSKTKNCTTSTTSMIKSSSSPRASTSSSSTVVVPPLSNNEMAAAAKHLDANVMHNVLFSWWTDLPLVNLTHIAPAWLTGLALEKGVLKLSSLETAVSEYAVVEVTGESSSSPCKGEQSTSRDDFAGLVSRRYVSDSILPMNGHDSGTWKKVNKVALAKGLCDSSKNADDSTTRHIEDQDVENVALLCEHLLGVRPGSKSEDADSTGGKMKVSTSSSSTTAAPFSYRALARHLEHVNFEIMAYHYFAVMVFGYRMRDVTNMTGKARWGSYLEHPQLLKGPSAFKNDVINEKGRRIGVNDVMPRRKRINCDSGSAEAPDFNVNGTCVLFDGELVSIKEGSPLWKLEPLWVSDEAQRNAESGKMPAFSKDKRKAPLFIFHADHEMNRWGDAGNQQWEKFFAENKN